MKRALRLQVILLIILLLAGCRLWEKVVVPERLCGYWQTSDPRYAGCWFEIRGKRIIFNNGLTYTNANQIMTINGVEQSGVGRWDIHYEDLDGQKFTLSLVVYTTDKGDVIRFRHQYQTIWTRKPLADF